MKKFFSSLLILFIIITTTNAQQPDYINGTPEGAGTLRKLQYGLHQDPEEVQSAYVSGVTLPISNLKGYKIKEYGQVHVTQYLGEPGVQQAFANSRIVKGSDMPAGTKVLTQDIYGNPLTRDLYEHELFYQHIPSGKVWLSLTCWNPVCINLTPPAKPTTALAKGDGVYKLDGINLTLNVNCGSSLQQQQQQMPANTGMVQYMQVPAMMQQPMMMQPMVAQNVQCANNSGVQHQIVEHRSKPHWTEGVANVLGGVAKFGNMVAFNRIAWGGLDINTTNENYNFGYNIVRFVNGGNYYPPSPNPPGWQPWTGATSPGYGYANLGNGYYNQSYGNMPINTWNTAYPTPGYSNLGPIFTGNNNQQVPPVNTW